jgi:ketosteroid isomerase-like protein
MSQFADAQFLSFLGPSFTEGDPRADAKAEEAANVRCVERLLMAVVQEDFDALDGLLTDDVELEIVGPAGLPMVGHSRGRAQVVAAMRDNFAMLEEQQPALRAVVAQGDKVVLVAEEHGRIRATGRPYALHLTVMYTVAEGRVARIYELLDTAAWRQAVADA